MKFSLDEFKYLFNELVKGGDNLTKSTSANIYISYSSTEEVSAKCLQNLLEAIGLNTILSKRGLHSNILQTSQIHFYFSFLPSDYGKLDEDNYFKKEVSLIVNYNKNCKVIFLNDQEVYPLVLETLINSIKTRLSNEIILIDFLPFKENILYSANKLKELCMSFKATDHAEEIMTKFAHLLTVTPESFFSDLYYRMVTMGVRHIPVIESEENRKYVRVISRRDLVEKVPPGGAYLPEEVQTDCQIKIDRKKLNKELKDLGKKKIKDVFTEPQNLNVFISPSDSIEKVVSLFSKKQSLGERKGYLSALPVLDSEGRLDGFISYTDLFRKFLIDQKEFLESDDAIVYKIAKISVNEVIDTLSESDKLRDALMMFLNTGRRAFPVVMDDTDDVLVGYLEDIQVKFFNYRDKEFADQLGNLGVEYMMIKTDRLYRLFPQMRLSEFISQFWRPLNGSTPAPSFVVCENENVGSRKLVGILSYVDVLNKWEEWWDKQNNNEQ